MKQSFSWWSFCRNGQDPDALVQAARRIGYAGVDLLPEEHWERVRASGLDIASISGHRSLTDGLNRQENHDRIEAEIKAALEKAIAWNIPNLVVFSGNRVGLGDEEGAANTAEGLLRVAGAAEAAGVTLILELLNSRVNHPDYQADRTAWGVSVCEKVGSSRVKLLYDIYHMQVMEGDVIATLRSNVAHIGHYHTAGVPGRQDLDEEQELYYPAICRAIKATGFDGYIAHEFLPKGDPIEALEQAFHTCNV
jgi:hydroxypyruvate isomerase